MKELVRPRSLTELVAETLRDWIISGDLDLGAHLSEARIASKLKVSRTPVREAINRLEIEGLLSVEAQRGAYVFSLEPEELAKLCDARLCLETAALRSAIKYNSVCLVGRLGDCTQLMTASRARDDVPGYLKLDMQFHQILLECSDNRFLNDAYQTISQKMAAMRNRLGRKPDHMAKSYREHLDITSAIEKGDEEKAVSILQSHIGRNEGSYWNDATTQVSG